LPVLDPSVVDSCGKLFDGGVEIGSWRSQVWHRVRTCEKRQW